MGSSIGGMIFPALGTGTRRIHRMGGRAACVSGVGACGCVAPVLDAPSRWPSSVVSYCLRRISKRTGAATDFISGS